MKRHSDPFRNVCFVEPEPAGNRGLGKRFTTALRRMFLKGNGGENASPQEAQPPRQETQFEPIVFAPVAQDAPKAAPVERMGLGAEAEAYLASLPNGERGAKARNALEAETRRRRRALTIDEAKEALVMDGEGGAEEARNRRHALFAIMFGSRKEEFDKRETLTRSETLNVFYYRLEDFLRIKDVLMGKGEKDSIRAKGEDRERALVEMERMINSVAPQDRMEAFRLIAEIVVKMGEEALCSKEACERIGQCRANLELEKGDRMAALEEFAAFVKEHGVKPSGRKMDSLIPRAEEKLIRHWVDSRPSGPRNAAEAVMGNGKAKSFQALMEMLEEDPVEAEEKRLYAGGRVLGRDLGPGDLGCLKEALARNIAYYCVEDVLAVTSLADSMESEEAREAAKKAALEIILQVSKRLPGGKKMEGPAMTAALVRMLVEQNRPKQWIIGVWLGELGAYVMEPDRERACRKLTGLCIIGNPMKVVGS